MAIGSTTPAIASDIPARSDSHASYFSSWTGGEANPTVQTIMNFVAEIDDARIEPDDRIAVFDNDGTLWSERPWIQGKFMEEYGTGEGETTDDYIAAAEEFLNGTDNDFDYPYLDRIYKPMVELLEYLQDNGFQTYICSGGGVDFIRAFAEGSYQIPPEYVIGSLVDLEFSDGNPSVLVRGSVPGDNFFFNDSENKPVGIQRYIGKRPIVAVGNSNGDLQMLQYTDVDSGPNLMMLVRHDDWVREGYYEEESNEQVNEALAEAESESDWYLISVRNDFDKVFMGDELP